MGQVNGEEELDLDIMGQMRGRDKEVELNFNEANEGVMREMRGRVKEEELNKIGSNVKLLDKG